jgi:ubiquitin-protein ligase E3 A
VLGKGLQQLLDWEDGCVSDVFMRTFEISFEEFGQRIDIPLCENGAEVLVTNENRIEYVEKYVDYLLNIKVEKEYQSFSSGFYKVVGGKALSICRPLELERLICGIKTSTLDFLHLEEGATYDDGYTKDHKVIK